MPVAVALVVVLLGLAPAQGAPPEDGLPPPGVELPVVPTFSDADCPCVWTQDVGTVVTKIPGTDVITDGGEHVAMCTFSEGTIERYGCDFAAREAEEICELRPSTGFVCRAMTEIDNVCECIETESIVTAVIGSELERLSPQ